MLNIQPSTPTFLEVVKTQKQAGDARYRLPAYTVCAPVADGMLLYNTLSCEMILLQGDEIENMLSLPYLRENWFAVPEDFDDGKFAMRWDAVVFL